MTEKQYLKSLQRALGGLSPDDRRTIVDDCRDHFLRGREAGKTEHEVSAALGTPEDLAGEAREELGTRAFRETSAGQAVRISLAGISVLLFNAIVVVGPYAGLVGVMAGLWACAVSILVSGAAVALAVPLEPMLRLWLTFDSIAGVMPRIAFFFGGISIAAIGFVAVIGMIHLSRLFIRGTVAYARLTWRIVTK